MDGEKRKRSDIDGKVDEKRRRRVSESKGVVKKEEPEDEEVEEFFAILRRIRVAVEYFEKSNGKGGHRELTATESSSLRGPCVRRRDFEGVECNRVKEEEADTGLDLNADPDSEPAPVGEPVVQLVKRSTSDFRVRKLTT